MRKVKWPTNKWIEGDGSVRRREKLWTPPFVDGRRMRILVVVDDCTRVALVPDTSILCTRGSPREHDRLLVRREGFTVNRKLQ